MAKLTYQTEGTCSQYIDVETTEDGIIRKVVFYGGCAGNTVGVARLAEGMTIDEAISRLSGIPCRNKPTSCPDQLARALKEIKTKQPS